MIKFALLIIFYAVLAVTVVTDYLYFQIYRAASLFLIPLFFFFSFFDLTPVTLQESALGAFVGYGVLWLVNTLYRAYRKHDGIGQGDMEMLGMIGSFLGPLGALQTLMLGSIAGSCLALLLLAFKRAQADTQLPFGVFLALGAALYQLFCTLCWI